MIKKVILILIVTVLTSCSVRYSFSGASISPDVKTVSIGYFNNMAPMVAPMLSPTLTDELTQKISRETSLIIVSSEDPSDISFEGEIIGYNSAPSAISGDEYATQNRLTVTVRVRFKNIKQPNYSFNKTFSAYADYDTSQMLISIEGQLIPEIVKDIVENVFNEALSNW